LLARRLGEDLFLSFELESLTCLFIELELSLIDTRVELLPLLRAQELFLFIRQISETFNLFCLNLTHVGQGLILTQKHINLPFVLGIFVCNACALLLCLDQLVFDFDYNFVMLVTNVGQLLLVTGLHLGSHPHTGFRRLRDDLLKLDDQLLSLLKLHFVLFLLAQKKVLQLRLLITVLVDNEIVLGLKLGELLLKLANLLA